MKQLEKIEFVTRTFVYAGLNQLEQEWVLPTAAGVTLYQGFKYGGSINRGVKSGAAFLGTMFVLGGLQNIIQLRHKINDVFKED